MTTPWQIERMREIVTELATHIPAVFDARVDDWNDEGEFSVFVYLKPEIDPGGDRRRIIFASNLRGVVAHMRTLIKAHGGKSVRVMRAPRRVYAGRGKLGHGRYFVGYDRRDYQLEVYIPAPPTPKPPPRYACKADEIADTQP